MKHINFGQLSRVFT